MPKTPEGFTPPSKGLDIEVEVEGDAGAVPQMENEEGHILVADKPQASSADTSKPPEVPSPPQAPDATGGKKPDKIRGRATKNPALIPAALSVPKNVERLEEGERLEQVIADVAEATSFGREQDKKIIAVRGEDMAKDIRRLVTDFQGEIFKNLPKEEQTKKILSSVTFLTSNTDLQADLHEAFREMGLLEGKGEKAKASEVSSTVSGRDPREAIRQLATASRSVSFAPKSPERQKTPEVRKAEALIEYFGEVKSGTDLWNKTNDMPRSATLRGSIELSELEQLSSKLSQKVINFLDAIEMWEKDKQSAKEMVKSRDDLISSEQIPSGCQTAFRDIANFAIRKILGPSVEALKASPEAKPDTSAPKPPSAGVVAEGTPAGTTQKPLLTNDDVIAYAKAMKAAEAAKATAETKTSASVSESPKPVTAPSEEAPKKAEPESLAEELGYRSRLWWNPKRKSTPETPPAASTTAPLAETAPATPSPKVVGSYHPSTVESKPASPASSATPTPEALPPISPPKTTETTPPAERIATARTPERIAALTFGEVLQFKPEDLREVLQSTTMNVVSEALHDMPSELIERVQASLTEEDRVRFNRLHNLGLFDTQVVVDAARKEIVKIARARLKTPASSEKTSSTSATPEKISDGWTPEKIAALTFENLFELSDAELRDVVGISRMTAVGWGIAMRGIPDDSVKRIRDAYSDPLVQQRQRVGYTAREFDEYLKDIASTEEQINSTRLDAVSSAKERLLEKLQRENPPKL